MSPPLPPAAELEITITTPEPQYTTNPSISKMEVDVSSPILQNGVDTNMAEINHDYQQDILSSVSPDSFEQDLLEQYPSLVSIIEMVGGGGGGK